MSIAVFGLKTSIFSAYKFIYLPMPNGDGDGPGSDEDHPGGGKDHHKGGGKRHTDHEVKLGFAYF